MLHDPITTILEFIIIIWRHCNCTSDTVAFYYYTYGYFATQVQRSNLKRYVITVRKADTHTHSGQ